MSRSLNSDTSRLISQPLKVTTTMVNVDADSTFASSTGSALPGRSNNSTRAEPRRARTNAKRVARDRSAAPSAGGRVVDWAKALVERKRTPPPTRNITLRLTGNSLEYFQLLESQMGVTPSDVFRDGLWIGLAAAERYIKRSPIEIVLSEDGGASSSKILDRGFLNTVERHLSSIESPPPTRRTKSTDATESASIDALDTGQNI